MSSAHPSLILTTITPNVTFKCYSPSLGWRRYRFTKLPQHRNMASYCLLNIPLRLFECLAGADATGQIRHVSRPVVLRLLENDGVA
jgi:hypothetical protein